tara:strand:- start:357 stop:752 length:396 start_codon:yes stop_codon:yes gene_type:complete
VKRQQNNLLEIILQISFSIKALHLITTKIKFRYIKSKLKDSNQNIDILFYRIKLMIKKYNDLKSENIEMKNKIDLLKENNEKIIIDLKKSRLNYQSLKIGKILESDNKQFVKQRIDKMIQDLDFCITNLSS